MSTIINKWEIDYHNPTATAYVKFLCEVGYEEKDYQGDTRYVMPITNDLELKVARLPLPILKLNP